MMIAGFILAHFCLLAILLGFVLPRYYDVFIPPGRRAEGTEPTVAGQPKSEVPGLPPTGLFDYEAGLAEPMGTKGDEYRTTQLHSLPRSENGRHALGMQSFN